LSGASSAVSSGLEAGALVEHKEVPLRKRESEDKPGPKGGDFQKFSLKPAKKQKVMEQ
jgi:hypothetical protein